MIKLSDLGIRRAFRPGTPLADYRPRRTLGDRIRAWALDGAFDEPEDFIDPDEVIEAISQALTRPPGWARDIPGRQDPDPVCAHADEVIATFREDTTR